MYKWNNKKEIRWLLLWCVIFSVFLLCYYKLLYSIWLNSSQIWTHHWLQSSDKTKVHRFNMTSLMAGIITLWLTGYPQKPPGGNLHSNCSHNMEDKSFAWKNFDVIVYNINTVNGDYVFYIDADGYIHFLKAGENIY